MAQRLQLRGNRDTTLPVTYCLTCLAQWDFHDADGLRNGPAESIAERYCSTG